MKMRALDVDDAHSSFWKKQVAKSKSYSLSSKHSTGLILPNASLPAPFLPFVSPQHDRLGHADALADPTPLSQNVSRPPGPRGRGALHLRRADLPARLEDGAAGLLGPDGRCRSCGARRGRGENRHRLAGALGGKEEEKRERERKEKERREKGQRKKQFASRWLADEKGKKTRLDHLTLSTSQIKNT